MLALVMGFAAANTRAAALAVNEQSATAVAHASVGTAAGMTDASTVFYNPAGMTLLARGEGQLGVGAGLPRYSFRDEGTTDAIGRPMQGGTALDPGTWWVPGAFLSLPVGDNFRVGVAATSPFGQSIEYEPGWVGRYLVTNAKLRTVDIEFVLAAKLATNWSIGGGVDWQRARLSRTSALDFGAICFGTVGPAGCTALGLVPQGTDGRANVAGNSNAWGYNLGILYEIPGALRVGMTYRSKMTHEFHGDATFDVPGAAVPLLASGAFRDTGARSRLTLPETLSVAAVYRTTDRLAILASVAWTRWSRIDDIVVTFDNPAQPPTRDALGWKDVVRAGVAMDYVLGESVTLHSGIAWDRSPIPADRRQALLPESDRWILGIGATLNISPDSYLATSYNYHPTRELTITQSAQGAGTLRGVYSIGLQGLGVSAGVRF